MTDADFRALEGRVSAGFDRLAADEMARVWTAQHQRWSEVWEGLLVDYELELDRRGVTCALWPGRVVGE